MAFLEIRDLTSGYGEVQILWGVTLSLEKGKLTTLVGSNGVGKTTLLRTVMGLLRPWQGSVSFAGRDITRLAPHARAKLGLVLVPEGRQLFTDMTVYENLEMGAFTHRARASMKENLDKVFTMFPRLAERRQQLAGSLSGGEQQMLAVARGLMAQPEILLIDELSLGLSPILALSLFESLGTLKEEGLTMLLVEQNVAMALAVSDYAYVLAEGRVHLEGPARELLRNGKIRRTYLGI
ncbi:MAG: ABC transporter ATP-binding protein [Deltaproteobacteria bacterium]|nr:ABC transporter ATP-binding protein [Deltaproteobacteria bacterium]